MHVCLLSRIHVLGPSSCYRQKTGIVTIHGTPRKHAWHGNKLYKTCCGGGAMGEACSDYFGKGNHKLHGPFRALSPCGRCWDGFVAWAHLGKEERRKHQLLSVKVTGWGSRLTPAGKGGVSGVRWRKFRLLGSGAPRKRKQEGKGMLVFHWYLVPKF